MATKNRCYADILAGHSEVTGSNLLIVARMPDRQKVKIVVDCGLFHEPKYENLNGELIYDPQEINATFVTHCHVDHCGRLPLMVKGGYTGPIFCTEDSKSLMYTVLADCYRIQKNRMKRKNSKTLFEMNDVFDVSRLTCAREFNRWYHEGENIKYMFLQNAHLQGAAMVVICLRDFEGEYINFLFTGDYAEHNRFFNVEPIPEEILNLPLNIVIEATYGDSNTNAEKHFEADICEAIEKKQNCIVMTPSLGRFQELLYEFKMLQDRGVLDKKIPIFADGLLAQNYTRMYKEGRFHISDEMTNFTPENLQFVTQPETREDLMASKKRKIILTTSGMGSHGPAQLYIPHFLWEDNAMLYFSCFCAEKTDGRKLLEANYGEAVFSDTGNMLGVKKATVKHTDEFSGHARGDKLLELIKKFKHPLSVLINHGETQTKLRFANRVFESTGIRKIGVLSKDKGFRVNEYGIEKSIATCK